MNKFTKVWFDENLGSFQRKEIPYDSIFEKVDAERGTRETTMRLTREELMARFGVDIKPHAPAAPEIWYSDHWNLNADFNTVANLSRDGLAARFWGQTTHPAYQHITGRQVGKAMVLADIQRAIDSLKHAGPTHEQRYLTAELYDKAKAAGYPLGGVKRLAPQYAVPRPPAAAKSRAALHPLVGRLIDNLNKEN